MAGEKQTLFEGAREVVSGASRSNPILTMAMIAVLLVFVIMAYLDQRRYEQIGQIIQTLVVNCIKGSPMSHRGKTPAPEPAPIRQRTTQWEAESKGS